MLKSEAAVLGELQMADAAIRRRLDLSPGEKLAAVRLHTVHALMASGRTEDEASALVDLLEDGIQRLAQTAGISLSEAGRAMRQAIEDDPGQDPD